MQLNDMTGEDSGHAAAFFKLTFGVEGFGKMSH
jgi:hypothetical protein